MRQKEMSERKEWKTGGDGVGHCQGAVMQHIAFPSISYRCLSCSHDVKRKTQWALLFWHKAAEIIGIKKSDCAWCSAGRCTANSLVSWWETWGGCLVHLICQRLTGSIDFIVLFFNCITIYWLVTFHITLLFCVVFKSTVSEFPFFFFPFMGKHCSFLMKCSFQELA